MALKHVGFLPCIQFPESHLVYIDTKHWMDEWVDGQTGKESDDEQSTTVWPIHSFFFFFSSHLVPWLCFIVYSALFWLGFFGKYDQLLITHGNRRDR